MPRCLLVANLLFARQSATTSLPFALVAAKTADSDMVDVTATSLAADADPKMSLARLFGGVADRLRGQQQSQEQQISAPGGTFWALHPAGS